MLVLDSRRNVLVQGSQPVGLPRLRLLPLAAMGGAALSLGLALGLGHISPDITRLLLGLSLACVGWSAFLFWRFKDSALGVEQFACEQALLVQKAHAELKEQIEQRARLSESSRQNLRFWETVLDTLPTAVFYIDKEGIYRLCNKVFVDQLLRVPRERVLNHSMEELSDIIPPAKAREFRERNQELLAKGGSQIYELEAPGPEGKKRNYLVTKAVFPGANGQPEGLIGVLVDITERKAAEEDLRMLWHAVEQSPTGVVMTDLQGNIQYVNPRFLEMTGYSAQEIIGRNPRILQSGLHTRAFYAAIWETLVAGKVWQGEFCNKRKDGDLFWDATSISPVRNARGEVTHFVAIKEEITARKHATDELARTEEALRQREAFLLTMTAAAPLAFYVVDDRSGEILHFSQRFCELWRLEAWREDMRHGEKRHKDIQPHWLDLAADKTAFAQTCQHLQSEAQRTTLETDVPLQDGRIIRHFSTQIRDRNDRYFGRLHLFEDITSRKQAEQQLAGSLKEKEILLREVYHRVKNNLQVISSLLNLQSGAITDPQTVRLLRETQDRVRSMALVHEKLYRAKDLSRIDFAEYTRHLVTMLARSYRTHAAAVNVRFEMENIRLNLDTSIPCGLILNELVSNALKYAFPIPHDDDSDEIVIRLHTAPEGHYVLEVCDTGIGMPEHLDIHNTSSLGLQVVSLLAEQLGGGVSTRNQGGAQFTITFRELQDRSRKEPNPGASTGPAPERSAAPAPIASSVS